MLFVSIMSKHHFRTAYQTNGPNVWPSEVPVQKVICIDSDRHVQEYLFPLMQAEFQAEFENFFHVNTYIIFKGQTTCAIHENRSDSDGRIRRQARAK